MAEFHCKKPVVFAPLLATLMLLWQSVALAQDEPERTEEEQQPHEGSGLPVDALPDIRDDETPARFQWSNFVAVPVPMSSPTFGTGLVLGGAYFYPQTEEQKAAQPASFTGAAAGYTTNDSWAAGIMQQNYWDEDKWRLTAVGGYADFKLVLYNAETPDAPVDEIDWVVEGGFFQTSVQRRLTGDWFAGVTLRYLDITQDIDVTNIEEEDRFDSEIKATGVGLDLRYDTRDLPTNPWDGRLFEVHALTNHQSPGDRGSYQNYGARFRTYHKLTDSLVLAGDLNACSRGGDFPLWNACWLSLRGFPITRYLGKTSYYAQAEARWTLSKRWGLVAFAGAGNVKDAVTAAPKDGVVPSYGAGVRFMVMQSQRVNIRVDYGRSTDGEDAWYLSVAEAF